MTWSINWDATQNYALATTFGSRLNTAGARVALDGTVDEARWWTQGEKPAASQLGPWTAGQPCT